MTEKRGPAPAGTSWPAAPDPAAKLAALEDALTTEHARTVKAESSPATPNSVPRPAWAAKR